MLWIFAEVAWLLYVCLLAFMCMLFLWLAQLLHTLWPTCCACVLYIVEVPMLLLLPVLVLHFVTTCCASFVCVWLFIEVPVLLLLLCAIVRASFEAVMNASTLMYSDMPKCMLKFLWWLSFFSYQKCGCTFGWTDTHILSLILLNAFLLLCLFFQF